MDLQLISKFNKIICFLTCITNANAFHKTLDESNSNLSKIRVEKGSEFYNRSTKSCLQDDDIEMDSTHHDGKSVIAERFIRILKIKIYKYMTLLSKKVYIDKLDGIINIYNNTYHSKIKMKSVNVSQTHILTLI